MKKSNISVLASVLILGGILSTQATAADLTASSETPTVIFLDTGTTAGVGSIPWKMTGSDNALAIKNVSDNKGIIYIHHSTGNDNSLDIAANGDISLAKDSVAIVRADNNKGATVKIANPNSVSLGGESGSLDWFLDTTSEAGLKNKAFSIGYDFNTVGVVSKTPFTVLGNANDNSVFMNDNGVGILNGNPTAALDIVGKIQNTDVITTTWSGSNTVDDGLTTLVRLTADNTEAGKASDAGFALINKKEDFQWNFRTLEYNNAFTATKAGSGGGEFLVQSPTNDFHDAVVKIGGVKVFENGHLVTASSRELKTDIKPLDTQAALNAFDKLQPVSYEYKAHKGEAVVGFIAEDVPALVAMPSRTTFDSTEVVAVLTSVLAETRAEMEAMKAEIAELKAMRER